MKKIYIILLLSLSSSVFADGFKTEKQIRAFTDVLMDQILKEDFKTAFDSAKPYWPIPTVEIDSIVNKLNLQWPVISQRFGKALSIEFIKETRINQSFIRYYFLHKFQKHAIYWKIDLYKPNNEWKINTVLFSDKLDSLYE